MPAPRNVIIPLVWLATHFFNSCIKSTQQEAARHFLWVPFFDFRNFQCFKAKRLSRQFGTGRDEL